MNQVEIAPNKTNLLVATRIRVTITPKGTITTNAKGRTTITISGQNYLAVIMDIIITIAPKFLTLNG
jgi:hypothetical protein